MRGTLHWVSAAHAVPAEVRLYDRLFSVENPGTTEGKSFLDEMNPDSVVRVEGALMEPYLAHRRRQAGDARSVRAVGYFCVDTDSRPDKPLWNRTVTPQGQLGQTRKEVEKKSDQNQQKKAGKNVDNKSDAQAAGQPGNAAAQNPKPAAASKAAPAAPPSEITIDDLGRVDLRAGLVREAGLVPGADKLLKLMVDLGEGRLRQIFTGLRAYYPDPAVLVGRTVAVVANLKPRQMKFGLSEGMILAAGGGDRPHRLVTFDGAELPDGAKPGDKIT